jgi:hypothetical protein
MKANLREFESKLKACTDAQIREALRDWRAAVKAKPKDKNKAECLKLVIIEARVRNMELS